MPEHEHDLVRVEDVANGLAWHTCRSCVYRTDSEPLTTSDEGSEG